MIKDIGKDEIIDMASMAGNDYEGRLFGNLPYPRQSLSVDDDAVIDVVPQPCKEPFQHTNIGLRVVGGNLIEVFFGLLYHFLVILFFGKGHVLHIFNEPAIPQDHTDDLFSRFQYRSHYRPFLAVDPLYQLSPKEV